MGVVVKGFFGRKKQCFWKNLVKKPKHSQTIDELELIVYKWVTAFH